MRAVLAVPAMLLLVPAIAGPVAADTVAPSVPVSWSVEPVARPGDPDRPNFVLDAAPGDVVEDSLAVQNLGDVDLVLGVYASDAFNTATGGIDLLAAGEAPEDLGSWVRLDETSITVPAGGAVEVPFSVDVPADADPGDHVGGIVTSLRVTEADAEGNRLAVERRLGTRIHLRVDGTLTPELTFTELDADHSGVANPFAPGSMRLTYRVENTGNVRLRATRTATVDPTWGPTVTAEAADMAELLPGNSYVLTQTVPGVWPGLGTRTQVELAPYEPAGVQLDAAPRPAIARTSSTLVPWPQLVALVVVIVGAGAWWGTRRRRVATDPSTPNPTMEEHT